jgi:transposase-like protein
VAKDRIALLDVLRKAGLDGDLDFLKQAAQVVAQILIEHEADGVIGAEPYQRTQARRNYRNGYRPREWDTRLGTLELQIPKLRQGSYFPSFLERQRRTEEALAAVIQEAYVHGVSTRKVDDLVRSMGLDGVDKSTVSRICSRLDDEVQAFRERPISQAVRYLWLDATYVKVRQHSSVVSMALVLAVGVREDGYREVLGWDIGHTEDEAFWAEFLRRLVRRGLRGVRLVTSDAHEGLKKAIAQVVTGAAWQRCRVHFMRNILAKVPKSAQQEVAAAARSVFAQPDMLSAREQLRRVSARLAGYPKAQALLVAAEDDILAHMALPESHRRRLHSTNPLERLNAELKRRSKVVGVFPNPASVERLLGAVLMEQDEEWQAADRCYLALDPEPLETSQRAATTATAAAQ